MIAKINLPVKEDNVMRSLLMIIFTVIHKMESHTPNQKSGTGKRLGLGLGAEDEVGALNEMDNNNSKALSIVKKGEIKDLGINYDRSSYKWLGHSPGEIMTFRTPAGVKTQRDLDFTFPEKRKQLRNHLAFVCAFHKRQRCNPNRWFRPRRYWKR